MSAADAWVLADPCVCEVCGRESCEDHIPADVSTSTPALAFLPASRVITTPRPVAIIADFAWAGCLTVLVSESGTGKTFLLLSGAAAISDDVPWMGRAVQHGSVGYISFEGDALGLRLRALQSVGHRLEHVYILRASDPLSPISDRDRIESPSRGELAVTEALVALRDDLEARDRPPIRTLVIDTVRASMTGSEDSSEPVAAYLRAVRRILAHVPTAAGILAHHSGWQDSDEKRRRERGSSAWRGNVDATMYLEAGEYDETSGEARLTVRVLKTRDSERPAPLHVIRRRVELAEMAGDTLRAGPVTSCIITLDRRSHQDRQAERLQATEAEHRETDLTVLRTMRDYPAASSISKLRPMVGLRMAVVSDAVARILRNRWATEGLRNQPYALTETGLAQLSGDPL